MVVRGRPIAKGTLRGAGASATEWDAAASARVCMREVKGIC